MVNGGIDREGPFKIPGQDTWTWAPVFSLCIVEGDLMRVLGPFSAIPDENNVHLTFGTKEEADNWSEQRASEWCDRKFPGYPVQPFDPSN